MKKVLVLFAAALTLAACNPSAKTSQEAGDVKSASEGAATYAVDAAASSLKWEGAKITETVHYGKVAITEGSLSFTDGNLEAGNFVIDMNSITCDDLTDPEYNGKLVGHLKSADFFMVETFPTAKFEVTSVAAATEPGATHNISGNLTIKDVTKGITFPANVNLTETGVEANAKFTINRNEWGIVWGGTLTEQGIKDFLQNNLIKDEIAFEVALIATK